MDIYFIIAMIWLHIQQAEDFIFVCGPLGWRIFQFASPQARGLCLLRLRCPAIEASGKRLHVSMWHVTVGASTDRRLPGILGFRNTQEHPAE